MVTISSYKNRIDSLMDLIYGSGLANHASIIEQINYLLFLRALSIKDDEAELLGITDESEKIFVGDLAKYRWQNLLALNAEDLFKTLEQAFELLQKKSKNATVKLLFRNAHVQIYDKPTLRRVLHEIETFAKELDTIAHEGNKDVFGDMYEYLLSKLSSAGTNGQFRTPRHIIDFMVKVVNPKKNETILDPACGTAGFLVAAYRYIAGEYTSDKLKKAGSPRAMDKLSADEKQFLFSHMFSGFDSDENMIKFGMMNLHLHGLTKSRLMRQNSLTDTTGMKDKFDVILANPPFAGKIDEESVSEDISMGTKATEILFLRFMLDHLSLKGKLAVIVPEGVIFNTSRAHTKIREMLLEKGLWAVTSLPSGIFNPYANVKTSILFIDKEIAKEADELLFVKVDNDGFDLGAQRRPIKENDLPTVLKILQEWKNKKKVKSGLSFAVNKKAIVQENHYDLSLDRYQDLNKRESKWPITELGSVATLVQRGKSPRYNVEGVQVIKSGQARGFFEFDFSKKFYVGKDFDLDHRVLQPGDLLINSTGVGTAGRITLFQLPGTYLVDSHITIVRLDQSKILPTFVLHALIFHYGFKGIENMARGNGGQIELSLSTIKSLKIPFPPLNIQKKLVQELGVIEKKIIQKEKEAEELKNQIAKKIESIW